MPPAADRPDLGRLRGVVAPAILRAAEVASKALSEAGVPHALAGGLAVGAHGYPRTTDDVDFLVGDEAFLQHAGGLVTLKVPLISVGGVRIDFVGIDPACGELDKLRRAVDRPPVSGEIPIVPLPELVYMKLKAGRQKDVADVVELVKRGVDLDAVDEYVAAKAPEVGGRWSRAKEVAAREG